VPQYPFYSLWLGQERVGSEPLVARLARLLRSALMRRGR
jgi:hypothetical protein